jgi:hypothetical protein
MAKPLQMDIIRRAYELWQLAGERATSIARPGAKSASAVSPTVLFVVLVQALSL